MMILTKKIKEQLIANYIEDLECDALLEKDYKPAVKLFGGSSCTWLLTQLNPRTMEAFGLCDLGMGTPEFGYVNLNELLEAKFAPFGLGIERDRHFKANKTIIQYGMEASRNGFIQA